MRPEWKLTENELPEPNTLVLVWFSGEGKVSCKKCGRHFVPEQQAYYDLAYHEPESSVLPLPPKWFLAGGASEPISAESDPTYWMELPESPPSYPTKTAD